MGKGDNMSGIETNIFPLMNLEQLSSKYKLYKIKGLNHESNKNKDESYIRVNSLVTKLSYQLQIPVTFIEEKKEFFLVVRDDAAELPEYMEVVRTRLRLEPVAGVFDLDYTKRSPNNDRISIKFLQFLLRKPLERDSRLWSPNSGKPFFELTPYPLTDKLLQYTGFKPRVVATHDGGIGLCVDVTHKYTDKKPLSAKLTRQQFKLYKGRHFIYRFGHKWYEIRAEYYDDFDVSHATIDTQKGLVTLIDYIYSETDKPFPKELLNLPADTAVVGYTNNRGEKRAAPTALCYQVYGPHDWVMKKYHHESILPPPDRRRLISKYVEEHLTNLRFGDTSLKISDKPLEAPAKKFVVPDFEYANSQILSVRGTKGARHVSLDNLGETRLSMLKDGPGFYENKPLNYHYLILPWSVFNSYGDQFKDDLSKVVDKLFPQENGFNPQVVFYDDRGDRIWEAQAAAIKEAVEKKCKKPGFAVVMIHKTIDKKMRDEDTLAAAVMKELRKSQIFASIIHTNFTQNCYKADRNKNGKLEYSARYQMRSKLSGYLQGVAINKILLNDFRTPFRLSTKLHADLTIGIDVKNHTAGFVIVGKRGAKVSSYFDFDQSEKEKISFKRMKKCFKDILQEEMDVSQDLIINIVIHRDGRFFQSEIDAIEEVIRELKQVGVLSADLKITFLEIHKKSEAPFRLFDVIKQDYKKDQIWNPQVGYYYIPNERNGYLCSTGRAFSARRKGTVNPLHIKHIKGELEIEKCLEDIYYLTTLTWTNPRDCCREPITIKLTDRYLNEEAGEYNINELADAVQLFKEVSV